MKEPSSKALRTYNIVLFSVNLFFAGANAYLYKLSGSGFSLLVLILCSLAAAISIIRYWDYKNE